MSHITANELKTRGIAAIKALLSDGRAEAVLSVRGVDRYVVMDLAHYQHLRECELEAALAESKADIAAGRFVTESPQAHLARLHDMIASDAAAVSDAAAAPAGTAKQSPKRTERSNPATATTPAVRRTSKPSPAAPGKSDKG